MMGASHVEVPSWGLDGLVARAFRQHRDEALLVTADRVRSYGDVHRDVSALAGELDTIDDPHRSLALLLPNGGVHVTAVAATALAQWGRVPLNTRDSREGMFTRLRATGATTLLTTPELLENVLGGERELKAATDVCRFILVDGPDAAIEADSCRPVRLRPGGYAARGVLLGATGGTTGVPKPTIHAPHGVRHLVASMWANLVDPRPGHAFFALTPLTHGAGAFILPYLLRGAAVAALPNLDTDAAREALAGWLRDYQVSTFLVPTAMEKLVRAYEGDEESAREYFHRIVYGGSPAAPELVRKARRVFGECLVQLFGQAETPMTVSVLQPEEHDVIGTRDGYCVGRPVPLVDVWTARADGSPTEVGEVGEVTVASDFMMAGYIDPDEGFRAPPFPHRMGDVGYFDENGYLWLVGRSRDMVISGGFNVFPGLVEQALRAVPGVADVIVVGAPHPLWGEALVAAVEVAQGAEPAAVLVAIHAHARANLAAYERPKGVVQIDSVPLTPLGKPDRKALLAGCAEQIAALWTEE